jgi:hypothetical protein
MRDDQTRHCIRAPGETNHTCTDWN